MSDPERLLDAEPSDLTRTLLSAARSEQPSERALKRTLLAVGAGAAVMGTAAVAGGSAAGTSAGSSGITSLGIVAKWLGIGATAGLVTAGAAVGLEREPESAPPPPPAEIAAPAPMPKPTVQRALPPPPPAAPATSEPKKLAQPLPAPLNQDLLEAEDADPSLNAEVAALDRARRALADGNASGALSQLEKYDRELASGRLRPEALYLEMEAAARRGDRTRAEQKARELLSEHPKSPHAARARALLSGAR